MKVEFVHVAFVRAKNSNSIPRLEQLLSPFIIAEILLNTSPNWVILELISTFEMGQVPVVSSLPEGQ